MYISEPKNERKNTNTTPRRLDKKTWFVFLGGWVSTSSSGGVGTQTPHYSKSPAPRTAPPQNSALSFIKNIVYLNYKQQLKKRQLFEESYIKTGYTKIKLETLLEILNIHSKKKIKGEGLWLSLKEPYNIGSKND